MEILLNLAWAFCSLGLVWFWVRNCRVERIPRTTQLLALAMVVLLLLPVISLSDDLMAMQGTAETDSALRRVLHVDDWHPSAVPAMLAMPEREFAALLLTGVSLRVQQDDQPAIVPFSESPSLDSRPPPQVQA